MIHKILKLNIFILFLGLMVGCQKTTPEVFVYTTLEEPLAQKLFAAFQQQSGIAVKFVRLSTGEAAARIEAEKNNPQASLWVGGVGLGHVQIKQKGLSEPYLAKGSEKIPSTFRDPQNYWTGIYMGLLSFVANSDQL